MCNFKQILLIIMLSMSFSAFSEEVVKARVNGDFKIGKKYPVLQYRANVREGPSVNSNAIAILSLHDRVEIVEYTEVNEEINHVFAWWYKIKYGNITGYTFGGNLASETLTFDIDKNGINDYFYFRFIYQQNGNAKSDTRRDIIIYINNQPIHTTIHRGIPANTDDYNYGIDWCYFEEKDGHILIYLEEYGRDSYAERTVYKVGKNGTMEFIEHLVGYVVGYSDETDESLFYFEIRYDKDGYRYRSRPINNGDGEIWVRE